MNKVSPKISVLIITYNQEKLISRALDSLLCQKEYIYEICINDDCSKDNTWIVLQEYAQNYPDLIKPIRNKQNIGIFQNIEAVWERPTGNMVYFMAGDDECGRGYFKSVVDCVKKNNIDLNKDFFCIYGDYIQVFPDGKRFLYKQRAATKNVLPIRLKIREIISNRAACYSINVHRKFKNVSEGRSYSVESVQDCQLAMFTEKNYYVPSIGNIYYAAIGVSTHDKEKIAGRDDELIERLLRFFQEEGIIINNKDIAFINFKKEITSFRKKKNLLSVCHLFNYYIKSLDFRLGWSTLYIGEMWRKFQRRKYFC